MFHREHLEFREAFSQLGGLGLGSLKVGDNAFEFAGYGVEPVGRGLGRGQGEEYHEKKKTEKDTHGVSLERVARTSRQFQSLDRHLGSVLHRPRVGLLGSQPAPGQTLSGELPAVDDHHPGVS